MKKLNNISVRLTSDGSSTLHVLDLDETYHSSHGAIQEAKHVFVKNGLALMSKDEINLLEVGFGTGLNAILACDFALVNELKINYFGLETVPLSLDLISELNYLQYDSRLSKNHFDSLHSSDWGVKLQIHDYFNFKKAVTSVQNYDSLEKYDLIFYDAFGPRAQKEMWHIDIFEKLYRILNNNGKLVTYCAMGQFKRDLRTVGFDVENVPGPPGKREMTIATKLC